MGYKEAHLARLLHNLKSFDRNILGACIDLARADKGNKIEGKGQGMIAKICGTDRPKVNQSIGRLTALGYLRSEATQQVSKAGKVHRGKNIYTVYYPAIVEEIERQGNGDFILPELRLKYGATPQKVKDPNGLPDSF